MPACLPVSHVEEQEREEEDVRRRHRRGHGVSQRHRQARVGHHAAPRRQRHVRKVPHRDGFAQVEAPALHRLPVGDDDDHQETERQTRQKQSKARKMMYLLIYTLRFHKVHQI